MNKLLLSAAALLLAACQTGGTGSPIVASVTAAGMGDIRTDGTALIAFGDIAGSAGIFLKGSGFPVVVPFEVSEGEVYLYNPAAGVDGTWPIGETLPAWARDLIPANAEVYLEELFGVDLVFAEVPQP